MDAPINLTHFTGTVCEIIAVVDPKALGYTGTGPALEDAVWIRATTEVGCRDAAHAAGLDSPDALSL